MSARRAGAVVVIIMLAVAAIGPWLAPHAPDAWVAAPLQPPSRGLWLGTDDMGQDLWSAWLYGARHSVVIGLIAALGATLLGVLIGASAGYRRGRWDFIAMRIVDFHLTLPALPLVLVVAFYAGASRTSLIAVLIFSSWARCARELHPQAAALRDADFIVAERAMGASEGRILVRHVIPVLAPMILAQFARLTQHAVLLESALSFLGLGDPQWASWGSTLHYANARAAFLGDAWLWWVLPPGIGIALLTSGFALLGVGRPRGAALAAATIPDGAAPEMQSGHLLTVRGVTVEWSDTGTSAAGRWPAGTTATGRRRESTPAGRRRTGRPAAGGTRTVLRDLDLSLSAGEVHGLVGVSGAGKTTLVQTILGLLPPTRSLRGGVWLGGRELLRMPERERRRVRGKDIAWISQAAMQSLNPVRTIGSQLREVARLDGARGADARVERALDQVGLATEWLHAYPHELSGGMRQRVVIAMALCRSPRVLLADEPASGLDSERASEILALIARLCRERRMAVLLIAHDLALIESHCDRVSILDGGKIVESGTPAAMLAPPRSATFSLRRRSGAASAVLTMTSVDFAYSARSVLRGLDLEVRAGECVGLVGPSGAGKTTIARLAMRLLRPARGAVHLLGRDLATLHGRELRAHIRGAHLIFQDPYAALPWHQRVKTIVAEPLRLAGTGTAGLWPAGTPAAGRRRESTPAGRRRTGRPAAGGTGAGLQAAVATALSEAGLVPPEAWMEREVDSLSGGERQRVALARALVRQPRLIIADEPTSMLDGAMKWAWLERLDALHREHDLAVLLITHDLAQANAVCDRILTLHDGQLTESAGLKSVSSYVMME